MIKSKRLAHNKISLYYRRYLITITNSIQHNLPFSKAVEYSDITIDIKILSHQFRNFFTALFFNASNSKLRKL